MHKRMKKKKTMHILVRCKESSRECVVNLLKSLQMQIDCTLGIVYYHVALRIFREFCMLERVIISQMDHLCCEQQSIVAFEFWVQAR